MARIKLNYKLHIRQLKYFSIILSEPLSNLILLIRLILNLKTI